MTQSAFNFDQTPDANPKSFDSWLAGNESVYRAFERRALEMAMSGRKHYSARTIVEVIRWNSDLNDQDKTFKINNNYTPGMAARWMERYGKRFPKFFKTRDLSGNDK